MPVVFAPLAAVAGALIAAFHVWLLGQQVWTGQLQYAASLRWLLAFALIGGLIALRRQGISLSGRRATALWVLAAVLHGPALADAPQPAAQVLVETSNAAIQIAAAALGLALSIALGRVSRRWQPTTAFGRVKSPASRASKRRRAAFGDGFLPRPPPVA
jgi:hypothetical protein